MIIRRAQEKDIPALADLLDQVLMVHHAGRPDLFKAHTRKYTDDELYRIIVDNTRPVWVAASDDAAGDDATGGRVPSDTVLGYAFCVVEDYTASNSRTAIKTLYIDDLCVDEACRGQHVGSSLYRFVVTWAREHGFYNVTLNVWSCNPDAQAFYERMGLVPYKIGMEQVL